MAVDLDVPARHGIRQSVGDSVGPGRHQPLAAQHPRARRHRPGHGADLPGRLAAQHHQPDDRADPVGVPRDVDQGRRAVPRGRQLPRSTWPSPCACPTPAVRPVVSGVNHFPVITELEVDGRDGFDVHRRAGRVGRRDGGPGPRPRPGRSRADVAARLGRAQLPQAVDARALGRDPGGRRPPPGRVRAVDPDRGVRTGARPGASQLTPDVATASSDQADFIAEVDAQLAGTEQLHTWHVGRDDGDGDRLADHRRPTASCPSTSPTPGSAPTCPPTPWSSRCASSTATGVRGRDEARAPARGGRAAAPPGGHPGADGRGGA